MKNPPLLMIAFVIALALISASHADSRPTVSIPEYLAALDELSANLDRGEPRRLNRAERREFNRILDRFKSTLSGYQEVGDMRDRDKVRLFNLQEELDTLLIGNQQTRLVCEDRPQLGTRIKQRHCQTIEERERDRERSKTWLSDVRIYTPPSD